MSGQVHCLAFQRGLMVSWSQWGDGLSVWRRIVCGKKITTVGPVLTHHSVLSRYKSLINACSLRLSLVSAETEKRCYNITVIHKLDSTLGHDLEKVKTLFPIFVALCVASRTFSRHTHTCKRRSEVLSRPWPWLSSILIRSWFWCHKTSDESQAIIHHQGLYMLWKEIEHPASKKDHLNHAPWISLFRLHISVESNLAAWGLCMSKNKKYMTHWQKGETNKSQI